jgi:hypothetical protein
MSKRQCYVFEAVDDARYAGVEIQGRVAQQALTGADKAKQVWIHDVRKKTGYCSCGIDSRIYVCAHARVCVCLELVPSHARHPREGHGAVRTCGG